MDNLTDVLNMLLAAFALAALIWGFRQRSLLRRLQAGLVALRQGRKDHRVRRNPEDREPVLEAFDTFAEQLASAEATHIPQNGEKDLSSVLHGICDTLRPPLVAIQSYASLLGQDLSLSDDPIQKEYLQNLNLQVNGLVRLLANSTDLSELRHGLSGLRRDIVRTMSSLTGDTLLLLDSEGELSSFVAPVAAALGMKVLIAPGEDAAAIMSRAISPVAIIVNVTREDGLGWRALSAALRFHDKRHLPVLLLAMSNGNEDGQLWAAEDIFLLPLSDEIRRTLLENSQEGKWYSAGDHELHLELAKSLDVELVPGHNLPAGMLALSRHFPFEQLFPAHADAMIFRRADLTATIAPLAEQFRRWLPSGAQPASVVREHLRATLTRLLQATSIPRSESDTLTS